MATYYEGEARNLLDTVFSKFGIAWRNVGVQAAGPRFDYLVQKMEQKYGPREGWTREQNNLLRQVHRATVYIEQAERSGFRHAGTEDEFAQALQEFNAGEQTEAPTGPSPEQLQRDKITKYIDDMVNELRAPVIDPATGQVRDSIYETLLKGGATAGMSSATMRGVGGGLAATSAMDTANSAALPYLMQRQSLLQNALGLQNQRDMGLEQLNQSAAGLNLQQQQFNNNIATNQWGADQNRMQGLLGGLGAVGGGIVGGLTGGPMGIVPGAKTGAALFAGMGSAGSPGPNLTQVPTYTPFKPGVR